MESSAGQDGLRQAVAAMVEIESRLEARLGRSLATMDPYLEAPALLKRLHAAVSEQREALQNRLRDLDPAEGVALSPAIAAAFANLGLTHGDGAVGGAVGTLDHIASAFNDVAVGYLILHNLAHRLYDITTANLADEHRERHLEAIRVVHQALGDVVAHDLLASEIECRCQCPSCGPGICLCWHVHHEQGTDEPAAPHGIVVRRPRPGSNAERAGLCEGDVILIADGRPVGWYEEMLACMKAHSPGDDVRLSVRHRNGIVEEMHIAR